MPLEIRVPSVGESVTEAVLAEWFKKDGDPVEKDEPIFVIETDKVTLEVTAEGAGALRIQVAEGETVAIGDVVGAIDTDGAAAAPTPAPAPAPAAAEPAAAAAPAPPPEPAPVPVAQTPASVDSDALPMAAPSVRRLVAETGVDIDQVLPTGPGGRVTKADVLRHLEQAPAAPTPAPSQETPATAVEATVRKPMSPIRKRIAAHLLAAKQNTAMLTTFNEIDMSGAMAMRSAHKEAFSAKYGVGLGFMSIFTKACAVALAEIPEINAQIDGDDIVYNAHAHIGVAIGSERGLVVPVIRQADTLGFAAIEQAIVDYVTKIKSNKLTMADMEGGTFTISNGGVYGSLLSTPILNAPQSAILGMHNIEKRPVVVNDEIVIRPMMYVALSYDHRIVDGKGAVTFLKRVKEFVEDPQRLLLEV